MRTCHTTNDYDFETGGKKLSYSLKDSYLNNKYMGVTTGL
jgi:hypothetical protein